MKVHSLTGRITSKLVYEAWRAVRRNRGAAGIDKVSIQMFEKNLDANLDRLMRELKQRTYEPLPARRVYIPKDAKGTKFRPLGIPAVRDRVAQEVLRRLLNPIFEAKFHDHSYGFRPGRSCHQAVEKVLEIGQQGYRHVLDADISGFFDNLSHAAIMRELSDVIADGNILGLVEKFLKAGVMEGGKVRPTHVGTPQGGVISPLLANIALNILDRHLHERGFRFVRYADDFVVLCRSEDTAKEALTLVEHLLADQLGLSLSPEKTKVTRFHEGFTFLGFDIKSRFVRIRAKSVENFKTKVRRITQRSHNLDAEMIEQLNRVIQGTANYFATPWSHCGDAYRSLDRWIRMRLRCMKFKRKSKVDNVRIRLKHFRNMGLLSLSELRKTCVAG
ncbi:MAG: group II intron reverse transcriptase/maturase [Planctomycetaceae bacterium]|nr:group II intron reverse transcriptase/maturase [Planctomycetaceae bacterium]MCB9938523.1 group II intron reverse transcriptase/maturase [Planctomycetaceae bacterium]MCB9939402.1 group II intron reverse transcriptase/maturase [Planctomycetaceae bacterium]MCB9940701.1 group II intron reverse transcriptase/maturase [Planctomycetaceae bacterium]MCB9940740.1 group II intron reverse transcriptase/maturase [Planctomycetaceae bacterium]